MMEKIKKKAKYVYPHLFPVLLMISMELQNASELYRNLPAFLISCILVYLAYMILFALTGRIFVSGLIASIILLTFYTINFYRQAQTGQVLIPSDVNLVRNLGSIAAFTDISLHWRPVVSTLFAAALHIPLYSISKHIRCSVGKRASLLAVSGLLVFSVFFTEFSQDKILSPLIPKASARMSYSDIYREQGALLGFYAIGVAGDAEEPEAYSRAYMEELVTEVIERPGVGDGIEPNVIVIMSESYWDPMRLPNITYSQDPVTNLHILSGMVANGNVVSPSFGGMTCITEYEFLTGNAMKYAGFGDVPYYEAKKYIDNDNGRSLVGMFKANGYQTAALHTYTATFFERDEVYPKLGFDVFIAEEDLPEARTKGELNGQEIISDEYFCDIAIDIIENADEPLFLFGITMQNHMPYLPDKYDATLIKAESDVLTEDVIEYVETYLEGVYDADRVLGRLFEYVMESDEPTILLYFGDHLPILTWHTDVYTDLGYISERDLDDLTADELYKMYATPYVAFSNYKELPDTWGDVSPYFLGALLADAAGIELNLYYQFLLQAFEHYQAMTLYLYISGGEILDDPRESEAFITDMFEAFQYDKLFGERYVDDLMSAIP